MGQNANFFTGKGHLPILALGQDLFLQRDINYCFVVVPKTLKKTIEYATQQKDTYKYDRLATNGLKIDAFHIFKGLNRSADYLRFLGHQLQADRLWTQFIPNGLKHHVELFDNIAKRIVKTKPLPKKNFTQNRFTTSKQASKKKKKTYYSKYYCISGCLGILHRLRHLRHLHLCRLYRFPHFLQSAE